MAKCPTQEFSHLAFLSLCAGLILLLTLSALNFWASLKPHRLLNDTKAEVLGTTNTLNSEQNFWTDFLIAHLGYLPGWLELTKLEIKKGNLEAAKVYLEKARFIDPNSDEVLKLERSFFLR